MFENEKIRELLVELGEGLSQQGLKGELFVVGGAALALAFDSRRSTRDVDAVFAPKSEIYRIAEAMVDDHDELDSGWLNDAVKGFILGKDNKSVTVLEAPGIVVRSASAQYLLAMKLHAARIDRDYDDIEFLAKYLELDTASKVFEFIDSKFPDIDLLPKVKYLVEEILD